MFTIPRPSGRVHPRPHFVSPEHLVSGRLLALARQLTELASELERGDRPSADWLGKAHLLDAGVSPEAVARLPRRHTGHDGQPCWHADEVADLIGVAERERRQEEGD
jgi:hypothetical protein